MLPRHQIEACKKGRNLKIKNFPGQYLCELILLFLDVQLTIKICTSNVGSLCCVLVSPVNLESTSRHFELTVSRPFL
jgi:hypothetical protein